jgi:AcrR family transcriptional regulator
MRRAVETTQSTQHSDGFEPSFTERRRVHLIGKAQELLATVGPGVTVEEFAEYAEVWPETVENYFGSKELLFQMVLDQMLREWVDWAYGGRPKGESLEVMIDVCRKLFRAGQTHPQFSRVLSQSLRDPEFVIAAVMDAALPALEHVVLRGQLTSDDFDQRSHLWASAIAEILRGVHTTRELSPTQADASLAKALAIWDVRPKTATAITSRPLSN